MEGPPKGPPPAVSPFAASLLFGYVGAFMYEGDSPLAERRASRLLCLDGPTGQLAHRQFVDLLEYLRPGDLMVFNNTRVIPARLFGRKETGGALEVHAAAACSEAVGRSFISFMSKPADRKAVGCLLSLQPPFRHAATKCLEHSRQRARRPQARRTLLKTLRTFSPSSLQRRQRHALHEVRRPVP